MTNSLDLRFGRPIALEPVISHSFGTGLAPFQVSSGTVDLRTSENCSGAVLLGRDGLTAVEVRLPLHPRPRNSGPRSTYVVTAGVQLRTDKWEGSFGDRALLRLAALEASGKVLAVSETPEAEGVELRWRRTVLSVPAEAHSLSVVVEASFRSGIASKVFVDRVEVHAGLVDLLTPPERKKAPVVYLGDPGSYVLVWETDGLFSPAEVEFGVLGQSLPRQRALVISTPLSDQRMVHRCVIFGLAKAAVVETRIHHGSLEFDFRFRTEPVGAPLTLGFLADNQHGDNIFEKLLGRLRRHEPQVIAFGGDLVQDGSSLEDWDEQWFHPLNATTTDPQVPITVVRGNHDGEGPLAYAYAPVAGNGGWFSRTMAGAHFIFLDSEASPTAVPVQTAWLLAELQSKAAQDAGLRVVCFHRPPFTDFWDSANYRGEEFVREHWVPLFERFGVDLVLTGHAHCYERGVRLGVTYAVLGGGGGRLDKVRSADWGFFSTVRSAYHYVVIVLETACLRFSAYDLKDRLLDSFVLPHRSPLRAVMEAPAALLHREA